MKDEFKENSQAVQSHLSIMQNVIQRMASNSSNSKAWCITLVSAILVILADKSKPEYSWISIFPIALFLILDTYYLSLEKGFRNSYNDFIRKLHSNKLEQDDLFVVNPKGGIIKLFFQSFISFSVWPFYCVLVGMIYIVKKFVL